MKFVEFVTITVLSGAGSSHVMAPGDRCVSSFGLRLGDVS